MNIIIGIKEDKREDLCNKINKLKELVKEMYPLINDINKQIKINKKKVGI